MWWVLPWWVQVKRSVVLDEGGAMVLQQPSFDAGGILQLKYYLGVCAENGCCNVDPQVGHHHSTACWRAHSTAAQPACITIRGAGRHGRVG